MRRRTTWLLGLLTAAGLIAGTTAVPAAAEPEAAPVTTTATFNDPAGDTAAQSRIRDHIVDLVGRAPAGSTISVAMYTFTENPVTDALAAAHARGVRVHVVLDHTSTTMTGGEYSRLAAALGTDRTQRSWVYACPAGRGCVGSRKLPNDSDGAINHNKFLLFSSTGGADKVVVQTSANLTNVQRTGQFNNAVTIVDSGLYDNYLGYFDDLLAYGSSTGGTDHYYDTPTSATGPYKTYFFPRRESRWTSYANDASTDTVKLILDNVGCEGGATQVRVAANLFTRDEVAAKLVELHEAGCAVHLAYDGGPGAMGSAVRNVLAGGLTSQAACYERQDNGSYVRLHSKYLIVEGTYYGKTGRKLVFTGSHNYTYPALRANDETLLKIDDAALYDRYRANHEHLMSYCADA
ncbi:phospholipase D-like domain-containing protein [Streptomyces sp. TRM49041]|uniref:phospholipase D-like domain-containing protein n=1 Tax=Streptomyces sp. TRM49041 TaxID=2603216 RepID=UPI0021CCE010|nr:phospholipase D-like domain-containing protein [Streptomyces sp. TRM49041]